MKAMLDVSANSNSSN